MDEQIALPSSAPVMPLSGALLFPRALLPIHIFEPRYRQMLDYALKRDRIFSIALLKPHRSNWRTTDDFFDIAGVGLIRACVGQSDGTSNLILQGLQRVRFATFDQDQPFPIARIEPIDSEYEVSPEADALGAKLLELYHRFAEGGRKFPETVDRYLSDLNDIEMLADLMAATFINDPLRKQQALEEVSVTQRLRLVIQYLHEESGSAAA
ncbi:MAG: LON peptidase substrate-binding domain-containing protein [Chthoniobacterales bacterium]